MTPRVSVLLPARDAAATIDVALASLVRQRERSWECIVVDDASRDTTRARADAYARRDPRIRVVEGPGAGIVAALQTGLAHCHAASVARMDADDWMHRDRLHAQCARLDAEPGWSGVGCHVRLFPRQTLFDGRRAYERWLQAVANPDDVLREAFVECPLAHPTWLVRRSVFEALPYRDMGWPEDYDWLLRALAAGHRFGIVPRRLHAWRDSPGRLSRTHPNYRDAAFTECKAAHLADGFLRGQRDYVLWGYGGTGRALHRALLRRGLRARRIVELHPRRIGRRIQQAPVIAPTDLRPGDAPLVASVAGLIPRTQIRQALHSLDFREGRDFVVAA